MGTEPPSAPPPAGGKTPPARTAADLPPTEVRVVKSGDDTKCAIGPAELKAIRERAGKLIWQAMGNSFRHLPMDQKDFYYRTVFQTLTEKRICQAVTAGGEATKENHNELREHFKTSGLSPDEAFERGLIGDVVQTKTSCSASSDWKDSPVFLAKACNEDGDCEDVITSCEDVVTAMGDGKIPVAMYATALPAQDAQQELERLSNAPLYSPYVDNKEPIPCGSGPNWRDTFNVIDASVVNAEYVLRSIRGEGWSAWTMRNTCTGPNGKTYTPADFKFNFGLRVFVPIGIDIDGKREAQTLVLSEIAAATNISGADLLPNSIRRSRFYGGEYAKKALLDATAHGWPVKKGE